MRSLFIIGPDKQLQLSGKGVAAPANWLPGEDVLIPPTVSNEDAKAKFGAFETILPYLRKTKAPG